MTAYAISGMTCDGCRSKVEKTLATVAPDVAVTLDPPRAITSAAVTVDVLNAALGKVGNYRAATEAAPVAAPSWLATYYPLLLVLGLIALAALAAQSLMGWMAMFMGGFFTVFGAFKLLDVPAFAASYARYDVIARHIKPWGYAYPFIEVALGLGFFFNYPNLITLSCLALVLSTVGAIGVIQAKLSQQTVACACLGTVFKLPLSVVTIIENVGMALMAAWMIWAM